MTQPSKALCLALRITQCPNCHSTARPIMPTDVTGDDILCRDCGAEYSIVALAPAAVTALLNPPPDQRIM